MSNRDRMRALRWAALAAQAATILVTWPLWQARTEPPLLPLVALPAIAFGPWLLASLALVLMRPIAGVAAHCALLAVAMLADQTREQPQVLSIVLLLAATLPLRGARAIGVLHLAALWAWCGLGKLTSTRFLEDGGRWLLEGAASSATSVADASTLAVATAAALGVGELLLGAAVLWPRTRSGAAWCAAALHVAALAMLAARDWNAAVWPWTALLAVAAPLLLRADTASLRTLLARGCAVRCAACAFVLLPLGFHAGLVDAPFAFQVYTRNTCSAIVVRANGHVEGTGELGAVRALLPPVPRIVAAWFAATASPGDRLLVADDRPLARLAGPCECVVHAAPRPVPRVASRSVP
jgi:hypothetical protein